MRVKALIAYDGSAYLGFQKQTSTKNTITGTIETALKSLHIHSDIVGSGRTDAGVHASGQVIHFDLPEYWSDLEKLKLNLNRQLLDISFKHISKVDDDFHARFGATKRLYRYVFKTSNPSVFEQKYISHYPDFDPQRLQVALKCFEGIHDFKYFHKTGSDPHTSTREVYKSLYKKRGAYHFIYFQANGFLRAQVRLMVDAAMAYAQDRLTLENLQKQLNAEEQIHTKLAPAQGLYLAHILYPRSTT